jgi:hypothetical protein
MPYIGKTPTQGVRERYYYTTSGSETSLSGADDNGLVLNYADAKYVDVYLNGLLLVHGTDYNTNTTDTIAGLTALAANDIVEVLVYDVFSIFGGDVTGSISVQKDNLKIAGVAVTTTAAELNKLDNTPAGLTSTELGYVDGVTSSIQTQLDAKATTTVVNTKAPIDAPTFTGTPAVPTASASTNTTQAASTAYVTTAIANLADSAPATLNTLNELAAALGDDANFSTTVTNSIATKAPIDAPTFTGVVTANAGVVVDNFTLDGTTLALSSGDLTIDSAGDIILDTAGRDTKFLYAGTHEANIHTGTGSTVLSTIVADRDLSFAGNDGGSTITALSLDMSAAGAATFNNNVTAFSDRRLKSDIQTIENGLEKVEQLRGVTYIRDDNVDGGQQLGVIAQEVEEVFPQVVLTADDERGTKSVDYGRLTGALIEAIKELSAKVKELEGELK